jgi:O-antigen/teichoic acid export membrane protein
LKINSKNSLWLASQYSISLVLSLIGLKLNLLSFGADIFSIWLLLLSIWGVGTALDFGFGISIVKFVAQYKNDHAKTNNIISTGFFLFLVIGVLIAVAGCGIAELVYLHNQKIIPERYITLSRSLCYLLGINFYFMYVSIIFRSVLDGHQAFIQTSKISLLYSVILIIFIITIYLFHLPIVSLAAAYLTASLIQCACYAFTCRRHFPQLKINIGFVNIRTFREIINFSLSVQISSILGSLIDPIAKYIIGTYSQNRLIPPFEVARRFSLAVSGLFSFSFKNSLPNASTLSGKKEYLEFINSDGIRLSRFGIWFSGFFFGIASIVFACIFNFFYHFNESIILFLMLAMAESFNNTGYILYVFILSLGKAWFLAMLQAFNVLCIGLFLWGGYALWGKPVGLLGFFISVLIGNLAMILYIKESAPIKIVGVYKQINMWKLLLFNALLLSTIVILLYRPNIWFIIQLSLSMLCGALFFPEIKKSVKTAFLFCKSLFSGNGTRTITTQK